MSDFPDFSHLRDARAGAAITIPLNGQKYHAMPDPPADLVLDLVAGEIGVDPELATRWEAGGPEALTQAEAIGIAQVSRNQRVKQVRFLEQVLDAESLERWKTYMSPLKEGATTAERNRWNKHRITLEQALSVVKHLLRVYSEGRPTEAVSSSNGHGDTGLTSTAGAPNAE